jgi:hypothetical protein
VIVATGVLVALHPLNDNSFFTHLATGRLILDRGSVPSTDPYSFTAPGEPWVVQSWLVSVLYAGAEGVAGIAGVRVVVAALAGLLAALGWRLVRPAAGLVPRLALGALLITVGSDLWAERPLMVGLIGFALVVLAGEGGLDPRWLVPIGWVWVNSHGSFPLGLVYLAVAAVGSRLDGQGWARELRCAGWAAVGMGLGAVGPLGWRALTFPFEILQRRDLLSNVVEWQAPAFQSISQRAFLLQLLVAVVLLARRPSYRSALVLSVFTVAALLGSRNLAVASIAALPAMASALGSLGSLRAHTRPRRGGLIWLGATALAGILVVSRLQENGLELAAYPVDVVAYLEAAHVDTREVHLAGPEIVGNLLTLVYGPERRAFYDDRFDMYPADVSRAALAIAKAQPAVFSDLTRLDVDLLTVRQDQPMALVLAKDSAWRILYADDHWVLGCRRGVDLSTSLRC